VTDALDQPAEPAPDESVGAGSAPTPDPEAGAPEEPAVAASVAAPAAVTSSGGVPPVKARPPLPAPRRSPYDGWLRVRGDVTGTNAIAVFLGGATVFLLVWAFLTAGGPDARNAELTVADGGRATLPEPLDAATPVWLEGFSQVEGDEPLGEDGFRFVPPSTLELPPASAGTTVKVGYDLGTEPIVSNFLLPKPTDVMAGLVELLTGPAFQTRCGDPACAGKEPIDLSSSDGKALEAYRNDPEKGAAPDVACPRCGTNLSKNGALAIPMAAQGFRGGIRSTLWRTTLGFIVAALVCLPLGVIAGSFPPIKRFISPLEIAGGYAPPVALLPLAAAVSGFLVNTNQVSATVAENTARIGFLFVVIAFWLYPLVVKEIEAVDQVYVNTAYTLGATRGQVVLNVLVPVASGKLWEHLRATYAIGWASIILAEGYASSKIPGEYGIGFFMTEMQRRHNMVNYFSAVLAIIATGIVIDYAFRVVGRRLFPWQEAR
jgi:NitT/TauT family transport system permease protein